MVGDDVDDAAPQHWRMRQQHRISVQLQWDELYLMKRGLDDADFLLGLKVDPVPSDPVGAKTEKMMRLVEIQVVALHPAGLIRKLLLRVRV